MPKPGKDPCKPYACRIQACLSGEYRFARVLRNFSTAIIIARLPSKTFAQLLKKKKLQETGFGIILSLFSGVDVFALSKLNISL